MNELIKKRIAVYRERNRNLKAMGFSTYAAYLKSPLWKGIREKVLSVNPFCWVCSGIATQVHHVKYRKKDLEGRDLNFLMALCSCCHTQAEFRERDGEKLTPKQASTKLKQMKRRYA